MRSIPLAIVTFHPDDSFYRDLDRYVENNQIVYVFCNCYGSFASISNKYKQTCSTLKYYYLGENVGLSRAYNVLLDQIGEDGHNYFYLFDQDTQITDKFFSIKEVIPNIINLEDFVLTQLCSHSSENSAKIVLTEVMFVINSGSLVNVGLLKFLGGYPQDYFVDGVDYFVCMKAKLMNLKVGFISGHFGLDHIHGQGDKRFTIFNKTVSVRYYGLSRIRDVTISHFKLIKIALLNLKLAYAIKLLQFLVVFYIRNTVGLFFREI